MDDLISRQAIMKHIEKIRQGVQMMDDTHRADIIMNGMYLCEKAVRNQPSVQPEQRWIPCSERLPERPDGYPHSELRRSYFLVSLKSGCVKSLGFEFDEMRWHVTGSPVLAWMPLPEPWKGEDNGTTD